jgi:hypothetical protein
MKIFKIAEISLSLFKQIMSLGFRGVSVSTGEIAGAGDKA